MSELFYRWLLPQTAAGTLAVLACLALAPLLNRLRPAARARAMGAAFLLFLVPVGPALALFFAAKPAPMAAPLAPVGQALDTAARAAQSAAPAVAPAAGGGLAATPAPDPAALVLAALPWVWAAGAVACTFWQWGRYLVFRRGLEKLSAPAQAWQEDLWQEACAAAGVARPPRLRACHGLTGPVMAGLGRPVLYLPAEMPPARLELAIRHEAAHLRRGDLWVKALARLCCRLHWFDPLCALHAARLSRACEYACDEQAAAGLDESGRRAYGLLLLDAAQSRPLPAGAAGLGGCQKELKARLAALLHPAAPGRRFTAGVAAALAAALCLSACAAAGLSASGAPASAPVSSASPQPLAGGDAASGPAGEPSGEPETTPLPLPMEEPAEKPELREGEAQVKWEHWTETIVAETDYTQDETLPLHSYVLERKALDGAEEVSGWVFYNELGAVVRKEPLDRVELQPAVRGIGRVNGEPVTNLAAGDLTGFAWPVPDYTGVSRWKSDYHKGADLMATRGSEVLAMAAGTVTMAQWHYSYGNVVQIDHGNGLSTLYAHLESMDVAVGDKVAQGQQIGTVGSTGNTTGVQCHVEVHQDGALRDLHDYFPDA